MNFAQPICPACGRRATRILETISALYSVTLDEHGQGDYSEFDAKVLWDSATPEINAQGEVTLLCDLGHEWTSAGDT